MRDIEDQDAFQEHLKALGATVVERFHIWLGNKGISMRQFSIDTGIHYHRLMRLSKTNQMGIDILLAVLWVDPKLPARWLLGLDDEEETDIYYEPTKPNLTGVEALQLKLHEAESVIFKLQERMNNMTAPQPMQAPKAKPATKQQKAIAEQLVSTLEALTNDILDQKEQK